MWSQPNSGTLEDFRAQWRSSGGQPDFIGGKDLNVMGAKVLLLGRKRKVGNVEQKNEVQFCTLQATMFFISIWSSILSACLFLTGKSILSLTDVLESTGNFMRTPQSFVGRLHG